MVARPRCNSKVRSDGNGRGQRRTLGLPAECSAACQRPLLPRAAQNAIDIAGRASELVDSIGPVGILFSFSSPPYF
jgi:hypothetical protein